MSDTACQTHVLRVALIALAASLWACDSKLSRTDRAASAPDGAEQSGVDQGVAPAGDQGDLPDSAIATSDSAPLERDSASGTEADAKVTPKPDTSVGPKPDAKVTPKPDTSVGPKPDGPTGTGGQAAILAEAFAAPDLAGCTPPLASDIVAPVQPFPADPMPASPLVVGAGGAYSSLSQALATAKDGDGILVKGALSGAVTIDKRVVVTGSGATLSGNVTLKAGATIQGFVIKASGGSAITVAGDGCKVLNNEISGHTKAAISISGVKSTLVGGNKVTGLTSCAQGKDCGERGVSIVSGVETVVADNLFYHNSYGVIIDGCTSCAIFRNKFDKNTEIEFYVEGLSKTTLRGNRIEYSGYVPGNSAIGVDGFGMRQSSDVVIDRNYVDSHYYGMKVYSSTRVTFSNNVSHQSGVPVRFGHANGSPVEGAGPDILVKKNRVTDGIDNIWMQLAQGITLECNEVYKTAGFKQGWTVREGIYPDSDSGPLVIKNNNLHDLVIGVRLGSVHDVTVGPNSFCNNGTNISGSCSTCTIDKGTQCP